MSFITDNVTTPLELLSVRRYQEGKELRKGLWEEDTFPRRYPPRFMSWSGCATPKSQQNI